MLTDKERERIREFARSPHPLDPAVPANAYYDDVPKLLDALEELERQVDDMRERYKQLERDAIDLHPVLLAETEKLHQQLVKARAEALALRKAVGSLEWHCYYFPPDGSRKLSGYHCRWCGSWQEKGHSDDCIFQVLAHLPSATDTLQEAVASELSAEEESEQ